MGTLHYTFGKQNLLVIYSKKRKKNDVASKYFLLMIYNLHQGNRQHLFLSRNEITNLRNSKENETQASRTDPNSLIQYLVEEDFVFKKQLVERI